MLTCLLQYLNATEMGSQSDHMDCSTHVVKTEETHLVKMLGCVNIRITNLTVFHSIR